MTTTSSMVSAGSVKVARTAPYGQSGYSLLELMVVMLLGIILSIGVVSLFGSTNQTSRVQQSLARLQENGRFAVSRMESDLRMQMAQYCSTVSGESRLTDRTTPDWGPRSPKVYASALRLPDSGMANSIVANNLSTATSSAPYDLSPRWFLQGYRCTGGSCTPTVPTTDFTAPIPATGFLAGRRVPNTDILTIRYQRGTGWPVATSSCTAAGGTIVMSPQTGDDAAVVVPANPSAPHVFRAGDLALLSDCISPTVLPVSGVSGTTLTLGSMASPAPSCSLSDTRDVRVFNMSKDLVTVSYFLVFRNDDSPGAPKNSTAAQRLIPTLVRRENGVDQDLVQGVDRLDFRYVVQDESGPTVRYLNAAQVQASAACRAPFVGVPGCAWASVRNIEVHLLVNSVNDMGTLDQVSSSFNYSLDTPAATTVTSPTTLIPATGLQAGRVMRREFVSQVSVRNNNP